MNVVLHATFAAGGIVLDATSSADVGLSLTPSSGQIQFTGYAPGVVQASPRLIAPTTGSLTLSCGIPGITQEIPPIIPPPAGRTLFVGIESRTLYIYPD